LTKDELLNMLNELKTISSKNETLLFDLQNSGKDDKKRSEIVSEIEKVNLKQSELMTDFISLCENKELIDKFHRVSEEKGKLFQKFAEACNENELVKLQEEIAGISDVWIESFQNIVLHVLNSKK